MDDLVILKHEDYQLQQKHFAKKRFPSIIWVILALLLGLGLGAGLLASVWSAGCQGVPLKTILFYSYHLDDLGNIAKCPECLRWTILVETVFLGGVVSWWLGHMVPRGVAWVVRRYSGLGECGQAGRLEMVMAAWGHGSMCVVLAATWLLSLWLFPHSIPTGDNDSRSGSFYVERTCLLLFLIGLLILIERVLMHAFLIRYHRSVYGERVKANRFALWVVKCLSKAAHHFQYQPVRTFKAGALKAMWRPRTPPNDTASSSATVSAYLLENQQVNRDAPDRELLLRIHDFLTAAEDAPLREADLKPFLAKGVEQAFSTLDSASLGRLDAEGWCGAVEGVYEERSALLVALNTCTDMLGRLHHLNLFTVALLSLMIALALLGFSPRRALLPVGLSLAPLVAGVSFMFGDSIKGMCAAIVYLLSSHPWDVGDRIYIEGIIYFVRELGLFSTRLERWDGHCIYMPNSLLATKAISNVRRSGWQTQRIEIALPASCTAEHMQLIQTRLESFIRGESHDFARIRMSEWELRDNNQLVMILRVQHKWNFQEGWPRIARVNRVMEAVRSTIEESGMARSQLPIKVITLE